jgi:DnaK suppressor protein
MESLPIEVWANSRYHQIMTIEELNTIQTLILQKIHEAEASDVYLEDATQPIEPSNSLGRLTRMEAIGEKSVNEAIHANTKIRLERLRNALERVEAGTYGICVRCKKEIALGRLMVIPEAVICISCAEKKAGRGA